MYAIRSYYVGVSTSYNDVTRELSVTVEAYYVEDLPFGVNSNFFQIAITESNIIAYQAGASSTYNHKHMLRHLITGQWGDEITEVTAGSVVSRTYTYTMPEEWVAENCEVVARITSYNVCYTKLLRMVKVSLDNYVAHTERIVISR